MFHAHKRFCVPVDQNSHLLLAHMDQEDLRLHDPPEKQDSNM